MTEKKEKEKKGEKSKREDPCGGGAKGGDSLFFPF